MADKKEEPTAKEIVKKCADCDSQVVGVDKASVEAAFDRHLRATGHKGTK